MLKQSERGVLAIVGFLGLVGLLSVEAYRSDIPVTKDSIEALIDVVEHLEQIGEITTVFKAYGFGRFLYRVVFPGTEEHLGFLQPVFL